jgi:hypothetical protein
VIFTDPQQASPEERKHLEALIAAGWRFEGCFFHDEMNKLFYTFTTPDDSRGDLDFRQLVMEAAIYLNEE